MVLHGYKIEHYKYNDSTKSYSSATELTDVISIDVNIGLGQRADSFSFVISNINGSNYPEFELNDRFKFYMVLDGTEYFLLEGILEKISQKHTTTDLDLTISGLNILEKCYNMLVAPTLQGAHTADVWLQHIIDHMNNFISQDDLKLTWASSNPSLSNTYAIPYTKGYTQVFKMIEELSQPENTDGQQYIYYINEDNEFVWEPKTWSIDTNIVEGTDFTSSRVERAMWDIVNYIIMNCGSNPYGYSILEFDYDNESMGKNGPKIKVVHTNIAEELMTQETKRFKDINVFTEGSNFPNTYPYKPSFILYERDGSAASVSTVANDSEYNEYFVNYVRKLAKGEIQGILRANTAASFKTKIDVTNLTNFTLGNLYKVYDTYTNWGTGSVDLRIEELNYHYDINGWTLSTSPEEDRLLED